MIKEHQIYVGYGADENGKLYSKFISNGQVSAIGEEWVEVKWHNKRNNHLGTYFSKYKINIQAHRFTWECFRGSIPEGMEIDHKDRNPSNNDLSNLRIATRQVNQRNTGKQNRKNGISSKYKGVSFRKDREMYSAQIVVNKKKIHLGHFKHEIDAAKRYDEEAKKYNHITNADLQLYNK